MTKTKELLTRKNRQTRGRKTPKVVERHFHDLTQRYGEVVAVDLTDQHGDEGELSRAYAAEMRQLPHVRNANFDNLHLLYDQISNEIEEQRRADIIWETDLLWFLSHGSAKIELFAHVQIPTAKRKGKYPKVLADLHTLRAIEGLDTASISSA
ncbi:hypothetical protein ACLOJK_018453 [Asimina triloba]